VVALRARVSALDSTLSMAQDDLGLPRLVLLELEHAMALAIAEVDWIRSILSDMQRGVLVWNEELIRAHFEAIAPPPTPSVAAATGKNHLGKLLHRERGEAGSTTREETP